ATDDDQSVDDTQGLRLDVGSIYDMFVGDTSDEQCDGLEATIRDFQASHPDFESYGGNEASLGLVLPMLGPDQKPQHDPAYAGAPMITSAETFAQWYEDVPGTNMAFPIELELME